MGDISAPHLEAINDQLSLICGDLFLSRFEDELSKRWPECTDGNEAAFRATSAFWRVIRNGAKEQEADVILMDLGPNLGAINRSCLISADFVVVPLAPDLFSLQNLRNLGPTLFRWQREWTERRAKSPDPDLPLPTGIMNPLGYIVLLNSARLDRPVQAYEKWMKRIPGEYQEFVLQHQLSKPINVSNDPNRLASLKHYRSLMPMAQEAKKPIFMLKAADGAKGMLFQSAQEAYGDFQNLAREIAKKAGLAIPSS